MNDILNVLPWKFRKPGTSICLLTGAGFSISAGLPDANMLITKLLNKLSHPWLKTNIDFSSIAKNVPLETVFQTLADYELGYIIQNIIHNIDIKYLSTPHLAVKKLADEGLINSIYTFNFDTLHEQVFNNYNLIKTHSTGRAIIKKYKINNNLINLIKLHGSSEMYGIITLSEYIRGFNKEIFSRLERDFNTTNWLILGYGGWDYDFKQALNKLLDKGCIPREVIWVDKYFPSQGGRSDIINNLIAYGTKCVPYEIDLEQICFSLLNQNIFINKKCLSIDNIMEPVSTIQDNIKAKLLVQLSFHTGDLEFIGKLINEVERIFPNDNSWDYWKAELAEIYGDIYTAQNKYDVYFHCSNDIGKKILCAMKLKVLSVGEIDLFSQLPYKDIPKLIMPFYKVILYARRTDIGGYSANEALDLCDKLPPVDQLLQYIHSSDWIRFLIYVLSEIARIYFDNEQYQRALKYDLQAVELSEVLVDHSMCCLTSGNVGVSYMGIAEKSKDAEYLWEKANEYLNKAVKINPNVNPFKYYQHLCNLGIVKYYLGMISESIYLLNKGIIGLKSIFPNYAICFLWELANIHADIAKRHIEIEHNVDKAMVALRKGIELSKQLSDYDDICYLKKAIDTIQLIPNLPNIISKETDSYRKIYCRNIT